MKNKKALTIIVSVLLAIAVSVSVFAIAGGKKPSVQQGNFKNLIADRLEITVENTDFILKKSSSSPETFTLTFFLYVKKTQGDFYGKINDCTLSGITYSSMVFTALNSVSKDKVLKSMPLTSTDGIPDEYRWQVDVTVSVKDSAVFDCALELDCTSGMTEASAQQKIFEIPITITVQN